MNKTKPVVTRGPFTNRRLRLEEFASKRQFVVGRAELLAEGFPPSAIQSWLKSGRLHQLFRGAYSYGRDVETRESAWRAGLIAAGPGSALTGRSALEAWGAVRIRQPIPHLIGGATSADRAATHCGRSPALRRTRVKLVRRKIEPDDLRRNDGLDLMRPSLALIDHRLILELDGDAFHTDPIARKRDAKKTAFLERKGFKVIRVSWKEFNADPDAAVDRIAKCLS